VNGAGLAMATMDIIKLNGGEPANFLGTLTFGNGLTKIVVEEQLPTQSKKPSNSSPTIPKSPPSSSISSVPPLLPPLQSNFFPGGIVRCDSIAQGLINTVGKHDINIPIVARLQGTNMNEANQLVPHLSIPHLLTLG
jgi:succinyl-CoA synthetase beta subunit